MCRPCVFVRGSFIADTKNISALKLGNIATERELVCWNYESHPHGNLLSIICWRFGISEKLARWGRHKRRAYRWHWNQRKFIEIMWLYSQHCTTWLASRFRHSASASTVMTKFICCTYGLTLKFCIYCPISLLPSDVQTKILAFIFVFNFICYFCTFTFVWC